MNISSNLSIGSIEEVFLESNQSYQRRIQIFYPYSDKIDNETSFIIMNDGEELFDENDSWNGKAFSYGEDGGLTQDEFYNYTRDEFGRIVTITNDFESIDLLPLPQQSIDLSSRRG